MKVRYNGPSDELYFVDGRIYEAKKLFNDIGCYGVVDEVGDCSLVYKDGFTIVEGSEDELDAYGTDPKTHRDILIRPGKKK